MQGLSALAEAVFYCTQTSFFSFVVICGLQPFLKLRKRWSTAEHRRGIWIEGRGDAPIALLWRSWW